MAKQGKKLNIKEIAKLANVSTASISRVFNNKDNVSPKLKKKVLEIIQKENYTPNFFAKGLSLGKTNFIGCTIPNIANTFFARMLKAVVITADKLNHPVVSYDYANDAKKERTIVQDMFSNGITGVLVSSVNIQQNFEFYNECVQTGKKIIVLNRNYQARKTDHIFPFITANIESAGRFIVQYLEKNRFKKIGYILPSMSYGEPQYRIDVLKDLAAKSGINIGDDHVIEADLETIQDKMSLANKIKRQLAEMDAVIAPDDITAMGIMTNCKSTGNKKTKFISYTADPLSTLLKINIPAVEIPFQKIGETAVKNLINWIDNSKRPTHVEVPVTFRE